MASGGTRVSAGNLAKAICDRCGTEYAYRQLTVETDTTLFVCSSCLDNPDPRRRMMPRSDALALERPRPDIPLTNPTGTSTFGGDNDDPEGFFTNLSN